MQVIVFSRTLGFRHASIPLAQAVVQNLGADAGWVVTVTEDQTVFTAARLASTDVVVFANTTGDVFEAAQEVPFEAWVRGGGGFVGIHSATDTEYGWVFYGELLGARFAGHPAIQQATLRWEDGGEWVRTDEWYNFSANPRASSRVVLTIDESTYSGGTMGADHPIAWAREVDAGRAFYTAGGHTDESFGEPLFVGHLKAAIDWAGRR
jgi:type 1 glutamine amidotransferase